MRALIKKEIYQLVTSSKVSIIALSLMLIVSVAFEIYRVNEFNVFLTMTFISLGFFSSDSISGDEKSRWNIYSISLPYKRSDIVLSKYILFAIISIFAAIIFMISSVILNIILYQHIDIDVIYITICGISISFILASLMLPFLFALGYSRGIIAFFITIFLSGFIFAIYYFSVSDGKEIVIGIMNAMDYIKYAAAAVISTVISIPLSLILFSRRQFK